jgi:hypothetical protein
MITQIILVPGKMTELEYAKIKPKSQPFVFRLKLILVNAEARIMELKHLRL